MTTKEAEEIVRSRCIAANPSIVELGFGCQVRDGIDTGIFLRFVPVEMAEILFPRFNMITQIINKENFDKMEILGREIQLADVLIAIEAKKNWPPYRIGTHGLFFVAKEVSAISPYISTGVSWNLLLPFSLQSDETKVFLANLLK